MSIQPCPACSKAAARLLDESSKYAVVNYCRCEACGHVWTTNRDNGSVVHHVTSRTESPNRKSA